MNPTDFACEHCGYPFDPKRTVKGPVICPACGLTAHPHQKAQRTSFLNPTAPGRTIRIIQSLALLLILSVLLFNSISLHMTRRTVTSLRETVNTLAEAARQANAPEPAGQSAADVPMDTANAPATNLPPGEMNDESADAPDPRLNPLYRALAEQMDARHPVAFTNDNVKLRRQNGQILRGQYLGLKDGAVLLLQNGEIQNILPDQLDRDSRLRVDPAYREKAIQFQMNKMTENNQGEQQPSASPGR